MKIWLDDRRPAPPGWHHVMTITEVKAWFYSDIATIEEMSLDHDLGLFQGTGYDLVKWMADTGNWPIKKPLVHSSNPPGRKNMEETIERYFPEEK